MHISDESALVFTIDSGTPEKIIAEGQAPQFQTKTLTGSKVGLFYTAANDTRMPNRGQDHRGAQLHVEDAGRRRAEALDQPA